MALASVMSRALSAGWLIFCTAAPLHAQAPDALSPGQSDAQRRYVERRLAAVPPLYVVGDKPAGAARGIVFGSIGVSAAWSAGLYKFSNSLTIQRKGAKSLVLVIWGSPPTMFASQIQLPLPKPGEAVGLMTYAAFKVELEPGDYEIVEVAANEIQTGHLLVPEHFPLSPWTPASFRVEPDRPVYLGRLTLVPELREPTADSRSAREIEMNPIAPVSVVTGFHAWLQNAIDADKMLTGADVSSGFLDLSGPLMSANPRTVRTKVLPGEIDHAGRAVR
jgi:hypothetical protein